MAIRLDIVTGNWVFGGKEGLPVRRDCVTKLFTKLIMKD